MTADNDESPPTAAPGGPACFSPALRNVVIVTTLGSFMAFLDSTIVNVALRTLSVEMTASLATIQWLTTAYLLAMAAVIPAAGWFATRLGGGRVYIVAVLVFTAASLACGLAGNVEQLIAFRVAQGTAGGLLLPISQMITMRAAGPALLARVMAVSGVPTILAPVVGPTIGGLLVEHAGWSWIFYVNIPLGLLTALLAVRFLPADDRSGRARLDVPGLTLVTAGSVALTYGLAEIGATGHVTDAEVLTAVIGGLLLAALFVAHALRVEQPLVDLRLYKNKMYAAASVTNISLGATVFGAVILMPLYFQIVRHEDAVNTGLLLIPQGLGAAIAISQAARLTDRFGSGRASLAGGLVAVIGTVPFALIQNDTGYWFLGAMMFVRGFGIGACAVPAVAAAYRAISPAKIPDATVQLNVGQRIGGSAGTGLFAVILQNRLDEATGPAAQAEGFATAFWWVLGIAFVATAPSLGLIALERSTKRDAATAGEATAAGAPSRPRR
ncbi:DHA2 family efflux MFS transporter permease subunit [Actinomadura decatromicini]|uniref:DHA2 family efflux MFS transporter permease subunit n=1 Tax=Actinomadura decatromicini TaxID=2604572 RepID=A0A5D3FZI1_9ACTN|nr:DHA2 family efflux MFS transporter permease subunit [Actinomadura decatromicini]TYK53429.1 DHA2 family efflux MFS transporter permease subunit [Actinomadura decatromicini]